MAPLQGSPDTPAASPEKRPTLGLRFTTRVQRRTASLHGFVCFPSQGTTACGWRDADPGTCPRRFSLGWTCREARMDVEKAVTSSGQD